jgi:hypothetical protein
MGFVSHVVALFRLSGFRATVTFGERRIRESNRKELALRAREAVLEQFEPVPSSSRYNIRPRV